VVSLVVSGGRVHDVNRIVIVVSSCIFYTAGVYLVLRCSTEAEGETMKQNLLVSIVACLFVAVCTAQDAGKSALIDRASQEFRAANFPAAERDFRELTKADPSNLFAHAYLGHALFRQQKFARL